jgi:hypothetical protein
MVFCPKAKHIKPGFAVVSVYFYLPLPYRFVPPQHTDRHNNSLPAKGFALYFGVA